MLSRPHILSLFCSTHLINSIKHEFSYKILYLSNGCRGSYTSAHVLLNLLNQFGKRDKMRGLLSILSLYRIEFNKFNNTVA